MFWSITYLVSIVIVNWGFAVIPMIHGWPPLSIAVGMIFVFRDYGQRAIGHWILLAMVTGGIISWWLANPIIALASICAFIASELMEWVVYTVTKRPFSERVVWSVLLCTPIDSGLFLYMIKSWSWTGIIIMTISKLVGAMIIYRVILKISSFNIVKE